MIGFLQGKVSDIGAKSFLVITSGGVGYQVFGTGGLMANIKKGTTLECAISTIVREHEITLYGFESNEEKIFFEKLITVSGVGPKIGLQILDMPPDQVSDAIDTEDIAFLTKTPGVGKKMAQKLILELKGKIDFTAMGKEEKVNKSKEFSEAVEALVSLGYRSADIIPVLEKVEKDKKTEDLIKFFLSSGI